MILSLWILTAYGLTSILVWGSIFQSFREWVRNKSTFFGDLLSCVLCTSTWVGVFMSITLGGFFSSVFNVNWFVGLFFDAMFTAGSVWALNAIIEFYEDAAKTK